MHEMLVHHYLKALQKADYQAIIALFAEGATVLSPLYGTRPATSFYQELLTDTQQSDLTLLDFFVNATNTSVAIHFLYTWTLADGSVTSFDCIDVFELDEQGYIKQLKIIYDTFKTRTLFQKLKTTH